MDTVTAAILGINGTLVGSLIWLLKITFTRLFGSNGDPGILNKFNNTFQSLNEDVQENTRAIRELQSLFKDRYRKPRPRTAKGIEPDPRQRRG